MYSIDIYREPLLFPGTYEEILKKVNVLYANLSSAYHSFNTVNIIVMISFEHV